MILMVDLPCYAQLLCNAGFVLRNQRVLICTTTAWVMLIALINFDRTTVPVDPLKSGTSTCSGLFFISLSLIPLLFSKKMSKGGEEGPWSTSVLLGVLESRRKQKVHHEISSFRSGHFSGEFYRAFRHSKGRKKKALHSVQEGRT